MTKTKASAVAFFHEHAGYSYDPKTETREQGRKRCARQLATAELWLSEQVHQIEWVQDNEADRSWMTDPEGPMGEDDGRPLFGCIVRVKNGEKWLSESLWSIDLGPTGNEADEYMRVVVAELAHQMMS